MSRIRPAAPRKLSHLGVPLFWPKTAALQMAKQGLELGIQPARSRRQLRLHYAGRKDGQTPH